MAPQARKLSPAEKAEIRKACEREEAACDPVALLGSLERQALDRALRERGLAIDPSPWGKLVGAIHVYNNPVFSERDGFLQFFNLFHVTSREYVVEREVVLRPGEVWQQSKIDETARRLRDPIFTSVAIVMAVKNADPTKVDILVVTRDVWSLRMNTEWRYQDGTFTYLTFSLSENNLLGLRRLLAATYEMDLNVAGVGPVYLDSNFLGQHIDLFVRAYVLFNREQLLGDREFDAEGSESLIRINRPLWNLDTKWGGGVEFRHRYAIEREFRQDAMGNITRRTYDAPETPEDDMIPWIYHQRYFQLQTGAIRGWGKTLEQRLKFGHQLTRQRPTVTDDFMYPGLRTAFERDVLPRSELTSALYAAFEVFTPTYREYRNVTSFDLAEDIRLGPIAEVTTTYGLEMIGSDINFMRVAFAGGYTLPWGADGYLRLTTSISGRLQGKDLGDPWWFIDNNAAGELRVVSPTVFGWFRFVSELRGATMWHETQNRFLTLGGDNGLRGFGINAFDGQRRAVLQAEIRTAPVSILFTRWGLVGFYDAGGAANSFATMRVHQDAGLGLRILLPQASSQLIRFDFAFPFDGPDVGWLPRITGGFQSNF